MDDGTPAPGSPLVIRGRPWGGPLPLLGLAIEPVYRWVLARKNARFDAGGGVRRFDVPVISIGNLSVGGTGKTPLVMHTLRVLMEAGKRPCVAMRGYRRRGTDAPDETDAYARAFPGMPIVARADRTAGLSELLVPGRGETSGSESRTTRPDCIVLDDGFQHRRIARVLDVVLIDATASRSVFADRCLPAGWLREPVESLRRASIVVLTHAELESPEWIERLKREIAKHTPAPIVVTRHLWTGLRQRAEGGDRMLPLDVLIGRRVFGCCGIGHPTAFLAALDLIVGGPRERRRGMSLILPDHAAFDRSEVDRLLGMAADKKAEFIVVTDKDWSKLRNLPDSTWPCPVVRPELAVVFDSGREVFDGMVLGAVGNRGSVT